MAISAIHHRIMRELFQRGILPQGGALLEIGQANWCDNVNPLGLVDDIRALVPDVARREALIEQLQAAVAKDTPEAPFAVADVFHDLYFSPVTKCAVDFQDNSRASRLDLNGPIELERRFHVVINHQTAEHVFHIARVFQTIHEATLPSGVMIHECAFTSAVDHAFYNIQPTLFFDLAEANDYQLVGLFVEDFSRQTIAVITGRADVYALAEANQIPSDSLLFATLRRGNAEREFAFPVQGYYRNALDNQGSKAWRNLR